MLSPSQDIDAIAAEYAHLLPTSLRLFLGGSSSARNQGTNIASYLLFEQPFIKRLIELGYRDAMDSKQVLLNFLAPRSGELPPSSREPLPP